MADVRQVRTLAAERAKLDEDAAAVTRGRQTGAVQKPRPPYAYRNRRTKSRLFPNSSRLSGYHPTSMRMVVAIREPATLEFSIGDKMLHGIL
jgi:hypothetical protein